MLHLWIIRNRFQWKNETTPQCIHPMSEVDPADSYVGNNAKYISVARPSELNWKINLSPETKMGMY